VTRTPNPHLSFGFGTHTSVPLARLDRTFFEGSCAECDAVRVKPGGEVVEVHARSCMDSKRRG
jgi:hypothetical protein